jgi:tetrapyrrole methylase family protein / MazG family protein
VVGLGPAGPEHLTQAAESAIEAVPRRFVRTSRHPGAVAVDGGESFDHLYERAQSFEEAYAAMVESLVHAARADGQVLFAVPGSPVVAELAVSMLRQDERVDVELVGGMSFLDLVWDRLGIDPLAEGVRLVDGTSFAANAAGERGPFVVAQCWSRSVLSEVKLAASGAEGTPVSVLWHLGLPDEALLEVAWEDLDKVVEPDHLTSLYVPSMRAPIGPDVVRLVELVRLLRERCPWDRRQTHASLERHLVEETYEVVEAIDRLDSSPESYGHLEEELGDLLFQILFHAELASEAGQFGVGDVVASVHEKLVRRHPHVFGAVDAETAEQVMSNWEQIKADEKQRTSVMDGIPHSLPALLAAAKVDRKLRSVGLDPAVGAGRWSGRSELERLLGASPRAEDIGSALAELTSIAAVCGVDAEGALRAATARTVDRFRQVEARLAGAGEDLASLPANRRSALWGRA